MIIGVRDGNIFKIDRPDTFGSVGYVYSTTDIGKN